MSNFHLQEIETLQNSLREREEYVTELENRLRALWDKYDGDKKHYMDRIKQLEEAKKTIDDLKLRVKRDFETILKFKAENEWLIKKIEQLYEVAEQQKRTIKELEEVNEYLRQKKE